MSTGPDLAFPQFSALFDTDWRAVSDALGDRGIESTGDFEVTHATGLDITVAAGTARKGQNTYSKGSSTTLTLDSGGSDDRWDIVVFDTSDQTRKVRKGTPKTVTTDSDGNVTQAPEPPDRNADDIYLARIKVVEGASSISSSDIYNWRAIAKSVTSLIQPGSGGIDVGAPLNFKNSDSIQDNGSAAIQFDGGQNTTLQGSLTVSGGDTDLSGNSLTDSTQNHLDLTGDGNDLRLATNQSIEDGTGTTRLSLGSGATAVADDSGDTAFDAKDAVHTRLRGYSGQPIQFYDRQASSTALEYSTSASLPGTLDINANTTFSSSFVIVDGEKFYVDAPTSTDDPQTKFRDEGATDLWITGVDRGDSDKYYLFDGNNHVFKAVPGGNIEIPNGDVIPANNVIPDVDGTGSLGTSSKSWGSMTADSIKITDSGLVDHGDVAADSTSVISVTFNKTYSSPPIVVHELGATGSVSSTDDSQVKDVSTTGFDSVVRNSASSSRTIDHVGWLAIEP